MDIISAIKELNFGEALLILVIGMVTIMVVLSLLIGCLYICKAVVKAIESGGKKKGSATDTKPVEQQTLEDEELVAAITAAITCIMQEENKTETVEAPFRIKKIKHIR